MASCLPFTNRALCFNCESYVQATWFQIRGIKDWWLAILNTNLPSWLRCKQMIFPLWILNPYCSDLNVEPAPPTVLNRFAFPLFSGMFTQVAIVIAKVGFPLNVLPDMSKAPAPFICRPLPQVSLKPGVEAGARSLPSFVLLESSWMIPFLSSSNRKYATACERTTNGKSYEIMNTPWVLLMFATKSLEEKT